MTGHGDRVLVAERVIAKRLTGEPIRESRIRGWDEGSGSNGFGCRGGPLHTGPDDGAEGERTGRDSPRA